MDVPIFFCERTGVERYWWGFRCEDGHDTLQEATSRKWPEPDAPPITCHCGKPAEHRSITTKTEMRRVDTGELFEDRFKLPTGAVWEEWDCYGDDDKPHNWNQSKRPDGHRYRINRPNKQDGRVLAVKLPNGREWVIDSRCNNCGLPDDDKHWCWCRHGRPEDGTLHVDKNGRTCSAGAGSIQAGDYHGFLHGGKLTSC